MDNRNGKRFDLRRNYSLISFAFILLIAIALGWTTRHFGVAELLSLSEQKNVALTITFRNSLWPQFVRFVQQSYGVSRDELASSLELPSLRRHVVSLMHETDVVKVKLYNLDGVTVFSTDSKQIGEQKRSNGGFLAARSGHVASELTHRDTFDAFEDVIEDRDLASSYLPIYDEAGDIVAVFELYSDVTRIVKQMDDAQVVVVGTVVSLLALLYAVLYAVVARAHRIIQQQRLSLERANSLLDSRVRERTNALVEANRDLSDKIIERRRAEEEAKRLLIEKDAILNNITEGVAFLRSRTVLTCNRQMESLFGVHEGAFLGKRINRLVGAGRRYASLAREILSDLKCGSVFCRELELARRDGSTFWAELTVRPLAMGTSSGGSVWLVSDVSERKMAEERMRLAAKVFDNTQEGVTITDKDSRILAVNNAFTEVTGYTEAEVLGKRPSLLHCGRQDKGFYDEMWRTLNHSGQWKGEIWNRRKCGEIYPEWLSISAVCNDEGEVSHYVGVFSDITEVKRSQEKVSFLAYHDPLTQLPNRLLFQDRLAQAIQRVCRENTMFAVYFIDLDHFKNVNDSLGHHVGDRLLKEVALQMQAQLRRADTIARLGGDEFIVLVEDVDGAHDAALVAEKLSSVFQKPISLEGHELYVTSSIGICLYPLDGTDPNTLIRNADAAMYRAKNDGRNQFHFYEQEMTAYAFERLELESAVRRALVNGEFFLCYQAQVDLRTRAVVGAEALVRWNHPEHGVLPPARFISLAEEAGVIGQLGEWVLRTACAQIRAWRDEGFELPKVAVNVSVRQLERKGFAGLVSAILREHGLPASMLELELTETVLMEWEEASEVLKELDELGVRLSVDDFGTGYSSLSYLTRLPVHTLKIDRSFITDVIEHGNNQAIVRAVIAMAKTLGLEAVAEGVESAEQAGFLIDEGCDQAQGFLFGYPIRGEAFRATWVAESV